MFWFKAQEFIASKLSSLVLLGELKTRHGTEAIWQYPEDCPFELSPLPNGGTFFRIKKVRDPLSPEDISNIERRNDYD